MSTQRQVALRLAQAWLGTNNLVETWSLVSQLQKDQHLFTCNVNELPKNTLVLAYSCAELHRLAGATAYTLNSFPRGRLDSDRIVCSGIDTSQANTPRCLNSAMEALKISDKEFEIVSKQIQGDTSLAGVPELARMFGVSLAALPGKIKERQSYVKQAIALCLQEASDSEGMLKQIESIPPSGSAIVDDNLALHRARALRDLNRIPEARAALKSDAKKSAQTEWLSQIVLATLDLREAKSDDAARRFSAAFPSREAAQRAELMSGSPLDMQWRLAAFENSDDVFLSAALRYPHSPSWQKLLSRYIAAVPGAGDAYLRKQFASWRTPGMRPLHDRIARTVSSQNSQWINGNLAVGQRRMAYEALAQNLAEVKAVDAPNSGGEEVWHTAWQKLNEHRSQLFVVLQHRTISFDRRVAQGIGPLEYTALFYRSEHSLPVITRLGASETWDGNLRILSDELQAGGDGGKILQGLGKQLQIPAISTEAATPQRLALIASGEFQQFPWSILPDETGHHLLEKRSVVQVSGLTEIANWQDGKSEAVTTATYFGSPDLLPLRPRIAKGSLGALSTRLAWLPEELQDARDENTALRKVGDVAEYVGKQASETSLLRVPSTEILHIRTHGVYLGGNEVPPADRSLMLFSPDQENDGILLGSETKLMRLDNTRLVTLAACESGRGRPLRNESLEGFRTAFHLAGAKSVLAPIWLVPSHETTLLMHAVYTKSRNQPWDFALREAQLRLRDSGKSPGTWAGWILSGNPF